MSHNEVIVDLARRRDNPARMLVALLTLTRPRQQVKNTLALTGLFFSGMLGQPAALLLALEGTVAFCCASGAVYALNDLVDRESDRSHPTKRHRPVASGIVPPGVAGILALALAGAALVVAAHVSARFLGIVVFYLAIQLAYSFYLKRQPLIDIFCVASGYVLRAIGGAVALDVAISPWLVLCTLLLALFLVVGKRYAELASLAESAGLHRPVLNHYSLEYLRQLLTVLTSATVLAYSLYAISSDTAHRHPALSLTIPLVMYGLFRYHSLVLHERKGGHPEEVLLRDRHIQVTVGMWALAVLVILYGC